MVKDPGKMVEIICEQSLSIEHYKKLKKYINILYTLRYLTRYSYNNNNNKIEKKTLHMHKNVIIPTLMPEL